MTDRPEWCPEDVWEAATEVCAWAEPLYDEEVFQSERDEVVEAIAAVILAERERCARIARNWPDHTEGRGIAERIMDDAR